MNIIMLDFDGVLKSIQSSIRFNDVNNMLGTSLAGSCKYPVTFVKESFNLDPECLARIRRLVEEFDFKIVISSTWRIYSCLEHFHQMFDLYDWDTRDIVIGFTPVSRTACRGDDIHQWIMDHPEIPDLKYVIIDDNDDFHQSQKDKLVQTDIEVGFTEQDVLKVRKIMENGSHDELNDRSSEK